MNWFVLLVLTIRRDLNRWRNRRARARHYVRTWPVTDRRDTVAYFKGATRLG